MGLRRRHAGRPFNPRDITQRAFAAALAAVATMSASARRDRGDVPGWVMITMMTAIVVIVLLGVFQEAVVNAVRNAFDSITAQGGTTTNAP